MPPDAIILPTMLRHFELLSRFAQQHARRVDKDDLFFRRLLPSYVVCQHGAQQAAQ